MLKVTVIAPLLLASVSLAFTKPFPYKSLTGYDLTRMTFSTPFGSASITLPSCFRQMDNSDTVTTAQWSPDGTTDPTSGAQLGLCEATGDQFYGTTVNTAASSRVAYVWSDEYNYASRSAQFPASAMDTDSYRAFPCPSPSYIDDMSNCQPACGLGCMLNAAKNGCDCVVTSSAVTTTTATSTPLFTSTPADSSAQYVTSTTIFTTVTTATPGYTTTQTLYASAPTTTLTNTNTATTTLALSTATATATFVPTNCAPVNRLVFLASCCPQRYFGGFTRGTKPMKKRALSTSTFTTYTSTQTDTSTINTKTFTATAKTQTQSFVDMQTVLVTATSTSTSISQVTTSAATSTQTAQFTSFSTAPALTTTATSTFTAAPRSTCPAFLVKSCPRAGASQKTILQYFQPMIQNYRYLAGDTLAIDCGKYGYFLY